MYTRLAWKSPQRPERGECSSVLSPHLALLVWFCSQARIPGGHLEDVQRPLNYSQEAGQGKGHSVLEYVVEYGRGSGLSSNEKEFPECADPFLEIRPSAHPGTVPGLGVWNGRSYDL